MIQTLSYEELSTVVSYLPADLHARLTLALYEGVLSEASKSILSNQEENWDELDFTNMVELSDDVLRGVLVCTDAKNKLKTLRLEGCSQIVGHGLEPLRESLVLEFITLQMEGDNALSVNVVIPILFVTILEQVVREQSPERILYDRSQGLFRNLPQDWLYGRARLESPLKEALEEINEWMTSVSVCIMVVKKFASFVSLRRTVMT